MEEQKSTNNMSNMKSWSLNDIAKWQINSQEQPSENGVDVIMPPLQRGYVWSSHQVEGLWDSLIRQLPIGSFLFTAATNKGKKSSYLLLDGQQRATSIALAFSDPWEKTTPSYPMTLWVDLAPPDRNFHDRAFMFRLLTRSHPWGYERNSRERLNATERYKALRAFQKSYKCYKSVKDDSLPDEICYPGLDLAFVWPWQARCPIPFSILWKAALNEEGNLHLDWLSRLQDGLTNVPFLSKELPKNDVPEWRDTLSTLLDGKNKDDLYYHRLCYLVESLPDVSKNTRIPGVVVPDHDMAQDVWGLEKTPADEPTPHPDAIESLFIRINTGGTPPTTNELIYSAFKAILPTSKELVERVGKNAFMRPETLVSLTARLVYSIQENPNEEERYTNSLPPTLSITRFRTLIHDQDKKYKTKLSNFMEQDAEKLFAAARIFLVGDPAADTEDFRLGPLLTENLARTAPDMYFLFIRWLYEQMKRQGWPTPTTYALPPNNIHRRILGILTAVAFFAPKPELFTRRLWEECNKCGWQDNFPYDKNTLKPRDDGSLVMLLLPSPKELRENLQAVLPKPGEKLNDWEWHKRLTNQYPKPNNSEFVMLCRNILAYELSEDGTQKENNNPEDKVWAALWNNLWKERRLVLYAQRHWLRKFFPHYNPAEPDQLTDNDRPFDWDHIFPQSYIYGKHNMPAIWRYDWPQTIGNLRAWPMELNRSDGNEPPPMKLKDPVEDERWKKILKTGADVRNASAISESEWEKWWSQCGPESQDITNRLKESDSPLSRSLLGAITERLCTLYEHWYTELHVGGIISGD